MKLTKLYWPSLKRSPKRLIVLLEPKSGGARPKNFFPALCAGSVPPPLSNSFRHHYRGPGTWAELKTGHIIFVTLYVNASKWSLTYQLSKLDRWSSPLLLHLSDISVICNFWTQLQILGSGSTDSDRPDTAFPGPCFKVGPKNATHFRVKCSYKLNRNVQHNVGAWHCWRCSMDCAARSCRRVPT